MGFAHVRGAVGSGTTISVSCVLGAAPATGDKVCVVIMAGESGHTLNSVKDGNNNSYTITPNSPSAFQTGAGQVWLAYLNSAPANASATITATFDAVAVANYDVFADEFSVSGGTSAFDKDAAANTGTSGTTINTPSITPTGSNELLYAGAAAGGTISSANSPWTAGGGAVTDGNLAEYDLSASSATSVNFTQSSGPWAAMAMAFTFTPSGGVTPGADEPVAGSLLNLLPTPEEIQSGQFSFSSDTLDSTLYNEVLTLQIVSDDSAFSTPPPPIQPSAEDDFMFYVAPWSLYMDDSSGFAPIPPIVVPTAEDDFMYSLATWIPHEIDSSGFASIPPLVQPGIEEDFSLLFLNYSGSLASLLVTDEFAGVPTTSVGIFISWVQPSTRSSWKRGNA